MSFSDIDLDPVEQLVDIWQQRAEAIRARMSENPTLQVRADVFDVCAAQLTEALRRAAEGGAPLDGETLSLFSMRESA